MLSLVLCLVMIFSLAACGKQTEQPAELVVEGNAVPGYIPSEIPIPKSSVCFGANGTRRATRCSSQVIPAKL